MRPAIDKLVARYETALSAGDLPGIGSCFDPPSAVIADDATELMVDRAQVKEYFTGMAERYRARGAFTATPTIRRVEQLTPALWLTSVGTRSTRLARRHPSVSRPTGTSCEPPTPTSH